MSCINPTNNDSCGKCQHNILSPIFSRNKSLTNIARILTNLSWMNEFNDSIETISTIRSINITCTGILFITRVDNEAIPVDISIVKYASKMLFENWYAYYPLSMKLDSYQFIKTKLESMDNISSITKMRSLLLSITKHLESVTTCTGNCTTVVPGKEVGICTFSLSDINKIVKFKSDGLVDLLNTILFTIKDIAIVNLTIDLNTTSVTCMGNISMEKNYIKCKSTINDMKGIYIYYLSAWCSANVNKQSEILKIRDNINKVKNAKDIISIYNLSCDLLEII